MPGSTKQSPFDRAQVEFKIVSQAFDSWNVQFRIEVTELLDQQGLLRHLRAIKHQIASAQTIPESCLLFDGILKKDRNNDFVDVVVRISKAAIEKGNPQVHFKDGITADGTRYARMSAILDIFYLDQFEKPVNLDRVMKAVKESGVLPELVDSATITRRLKEVTEKQLPVKSIPIAKGTFPDVGQDSELEFFFQAVAEMGNTDLYYSSRRVNKGDLVCRKSAATVGEKPGLNAAGEKLPPRAGLDVALKVESGAGLSLESNEVKAEAEGVVVISRTMKRLKTLNGTKEYPESIVVKVNPVLRIEGNRVLDIATSHTVEIVGDLCMGSRILTDCEVFVSGDVEEGTLIQAADDVIVQGRVSGSDLNSQSSVIARGGVSGSHVVAKDKIIVEGNVKNSSLTGDTVSAESTAGSNILARRSVTVDRIEADENNILSTICVGMTAFFKQRIAENREFLEKARANLLRIEMLVGREIMDEINPTNLQSMLLKHMARVRMGRDAQSRGQVEVYRKLLESILPTRALVSQKSFESAELLKRITENSENEANVVIVREKIAARTVVSVDGVEAEVDQISGPVEIRSDGKTNLVIETNPPPKDQNEK